MATSISTTLVLCLKFFNQLQEQVEQPEYSREEDVSHASWGDELGRLRVWAANIGAHQTGQSSLDFRLRDASHISNQITKLLRDLEQSLHDIFDELSKDETESLEDDVADWPGDESTTELQQLHEEVVNIIDCLYQLSMLIRKPAQHDMLIGSRMSDMAQFEFYDKEHVRNLHPKTEEHLGQRLGRAITRRRKYLSYRERHHRKLERGIEAAQGIQRTTTGSVISETIATDLQTPNIDFEDTSSNSGMSQTSYAPSLVDGGRITIPPPPRDSVGGKPFECPYCFYLIEIKSTRSWTRHIFKDIKPYMCTFPECSMPDRLYDSRREWFFHETTEHPQADLVCSLCKDILKSSKQYERHVARHLEELALFALPRTEMDDAEDVDDDDISDARALASDNDIPFDSPSEGSSVEHEEGNTSLNTQNSTTRVDNPSDSSSTPANSGQVNSEDAPKKDIYFKGFRLSNIGQSIIREADHGRFIDNGIGSISDKELSRILNSSSLRAEPAVEAEIQMTDKEHQPAAEKDRAAATVQSYPSADIKFIDALGRRFSFPFDAVNTWPRIEHVIQEIFLVVPNLNLRVADGQYDLCGPQDEILLPSNWSSVIEPGWEVTMRMWPNPERPPWEYAGPMAMLQDRHNIRLRKQDEGLPHSVAEQEQNALYANSENPPYRMREPTTEFVEDIEVEERRPRILDEPRHKRLSFVRSHSWDSDDTGEDHAIARRQGSEAEDQSTTEAKEPSDETIGRSAPIPFRKQAPFGPFHHYRGDQ